MNPILPILASLAVSLAATSGSLYFSEVMFFYPCSLCWIQRFFMYPLSLIFAISLLKKDRAVFGYALPFSVSGLCVAVYHYFLQWDFIPKEACYDGTCGVRYIEWLGFITIPFLSLIGFSLITFSMILLWKKSG